MPKLALVWPDTMKSGLCEGTQRHYATQIESNGFDLADRLKLFELDEDDISMSVPKMISDYRTSIYSTEMNLRLV